MKKYGHKRAFIVCDFNTYKAGGNWVKRVLDQAGCANTLFIFSEEDLVPDEAAMGELTVAFDKDADLIIAVGTGTINEAASLSVIRWDWIILLLQPLLQWTALLPQGRRSLPII